MIGEIKVFYQVNGDKFSTCDLVELVKRMRYLLVT